jgi:thymidylate kinase
MKKPQLYFVSGVSGVGKSSTMRYLKEMLPANEYDVRDFDERGVPDGWGREWHDAETLHWFDVALKNAKEGKSTIVCGFTDPERIKNLHQLHHVPTQLFLLHASPEVARERLLGRESTPERIAEIERATGMPLQQFVERVTNHGRQLRELFEKEALPIIETDTKTPEEVAKEVIELIHSDE